VFFDNTHFIYSGHGSPDNFGAGNDTQITELLTARDVGNALGNDYNAIDGLTAARNPRRYVEMDGCKTGGGQLGWAFGIPKEDLDQYENTFEVPRQSYVGWAGLVSKGFWQLSKYQVYVDYLHQFWDGEMDLAIRDASLFARNAGGNQVPLSEIVIVGSKLTTWLQNPDNL
jgi:hypothetical protein